MKIMITGASGFIGSNLCSMLINKNFNVISLGRTNPSSEISKKIKHIPYLMGEKIPDDINLFAPDILIHLAWDEIPFFSEKNCLDNVISQLSFLKQIKEIGTVKKIIAAGSCLEYAGSVGSCEEGEQVPPNSFFSWAKQSISNYIKVLCEEQKIAWTWFRIFYVYGPGQRSESLIPYIFQCYKLNKKVEINNPTAANDFIYIDDVVDAFISAVDNFECQGIINLGSGAPVTADSIHLLIKGVIHQTNLMERNNYTKVFDDKCIWADTSVMQNHNIIPKISMKEGIDLIYKSFSNEQ